MHWRHAVVVLGSLCQVSPQVGPNAVGDLFGSSISAAGDVDRDGHSDVLVAVGAWSSRPADDPSACVFSGRTGEMLLAVGAGLEVNRFDNRSVCGTGDLDGDGVPDLALAAWEPEQERGAYRVVAYSGKDGSVLHSIRLDGKRRISGVSICSTSDCDGDGVPDLGVGVMDVYSQEPAGIICLISGKFGALIAEVTEDDCDWRWRGSIASIGDLDRDGVPDVAVPSVELGRDRHANGKARIDVLSGRDLRLTRSFAVPVGWNPTPECAAAGDFDRDGKPDLLVSGSNEGLFAAVLSGLDGSTLVRFENRLCPVKGSDLCCLGDIDGDGGEDFALSEFDSGRDCVGVSIFSGRTGDLLDRIPQSRDWASPSHLGYSVAAAGDVNADGSPDLLVGTSCPWGMEVGRAEVYSGRDGTLLHRWSRRDLVRSAGAQPK